MPKRKVLLVDDEVTVLLTMKAILEISGFDVDTAASAREGRAKIRTREYGMVITDLRMESDAAGREVIHAARTASYHPAVALLTAYPLADEDWQEMGANQMLVKPMDTRVLLGQIEKLFTSHATKLAKIAAAATAPTPTAPKKSAAKRLASKTAAKPAKTAAKPAKAVAKTTSAKKQPATKKQPAAKKTTKAAAKRR